MRSRRAAREDVAEVARRRLDLLSAELAGLRRDNAVPPTAPPAGPAAPPASEPQPAPGPPPPPEPPADPTGGRHARRSIGARERAAGWVHDRLPPTLQGRVQLGSSHLAVVAVLVVAALAATGWWVVRADGASTLLGAPDATQGQTAGDLAVHGQPRGSARGSSSGPSGQDQSAPANSPAGLVALQGAGATEAPGPTAPSPTGRIVVDVAGKVRRPGIASLPAGSRVVDALRAAGGPRPGVSLAGLNLARVLSDGEQVVVGVPPPAGVAAPAASAPGTAAAGPTRLLNLNTATESELESLPQVGPVTAAAIVEWRTRNGAFSAVDELLEVSGIGDATLAKIAPFVTL
jgi:competence protein ComEA